ncbi:MAG: hypothetical protein VYE77_04085 [Planctomycetota bacterium]|nr:hypothetical protein [Planctomycetota bacterium]
MAATANAQADPPEVPEKQAPERLQKWPPSTEAQRRRVIALIGQFRKDNPELHDKAEQDLLATGDIAIPVLMQKVSDREPNLNEQIFAVLDELLQPRHAMLMSKQVKGKRFELRRYLVRRLCQFHAADMNKLFQRVQSDEDEEIAFFASLGLLGLGDLEQLDPVLTYANQHWTEQRDLMAEVLVAARSEAAGTALAAKIADARSPEVATGLRLMRYLATRSQRVLVRNYLLAEDHNVKKAAINTMRVLSGQPPIEKLSVFQTIEMAKEWLDK